MLIREPEVQSSLKTTPVNSSGDHAIRVLQKSLEESPIPGNCVRLQKRGLRQDVAGIDDESSRHDADRKLGYALIASSGTLARTEFGRTCEVDEKRSRRAGASRRWQHRHWVPGSSSPLASTVTTRLISAAE